MRTSFSIPGLLALSLLLPACREEAPAPEVAGVALEPAFPALRFENPLFLTAVPGSEELAVVTQEGRIHRFPARPDSAETRILLDIRDRVAAGGEMGLLGLAFDPGFRENGYFYVNYTRDDPRRSVISRFRAVGGQADPASETILLEFSQPYSNHNGGMLAFGPDGMLYIGTGDGGSANDPDNRAQRLDNLLGKILRIRPEPGNLIPPDNPYVGVTGVEPAIWAHGLRNPWRFSFDPGTGLLWAGDVGQNAREEIDIIRKGGNYGWRIYEGELSHINPDNRPASDFSMPVWTYSHELGQSVTGGYVYRGTELPELRGRYIYADFISGAIWALDYGNGEVPDNRRIGSVANPGSFGTDARGELYITSFDGRIYRLTAAE